MAIQTPVEAVAAARRRRGVPAWVWVGVLTVLGGVLRFACLGRPEIWGDEAATFHRVASSYMDLLAVLQADGFVPLHYELYWVMARWVTLTPGMMRVVPALAGTLMVPAMYFLARQLVSRRAAILAAALAACSAWLMVYSHDAKMYMHFWLFLTLHVGCLLWWMGKPTRLAWLAMVACGVAMCGLHATGMIILGFDVLVFLAHPRTTWRRGVAFAVAMVVIASGPGGYYLGFNRFASNIRESGWDRSMIQWVEWRNEGKTTWELLADTASAHLMAFDFIHETMKMSDPPVPTARWIVRTAWTILGLLAGFAVLGVFWRGAGRGGAGSVTGGTPVLRRENLPVALSIFYLTTWVAVPVYVFYCASVQGFASPAAMLPWWAWAGAAVFISVGVVKFRPFRERVWDVVVPAAVPVLMCCVVYMAMKDRNPRSIWMPRYLGIVWPAVAIGLCALYVRLPRGLRYPAIALLLGVNLVQSVARLALATEGPVSVVARDVWENRDPKGVARTYVQMPTGFGFSPGGANVQSVVGLYHLRVLSGMPMRATEFRFVSADRVTPIRRTDGPDTIERDLRRADDVKSITVWSIVNSYADEEEKRVLGILGNGARVVSKTDYPVRVYWTWSLTYVYRRTVYTRP